MRRWLALAVILLPLHPCSAAVPITGQVVENFSSDTNVAGYVLVGLRVGDATGAVMLPDMRLALPQRSKTEEACVEGTTGDGRYALQGSFNLPKGPPEEGILEPKKWSYAAELRQYSGDEFALRAEIKTDCSEASDGTLIPSILSESGLTTMVALINSQRAITVTASLAGPRRTFKVTGDCRSTNAERSTAFDTICTFPLSGIHHQSLMVLSVDRLTRAGDDDCDQFKVELDPKAW